MLDGVGLRRIVAAIAVLSVPCLAAPPHETAHEAGGAELTVRVENVSPLGGIIRLGLYDEARYPNDESVPVASADVKAVAGETVIVLHGIAPGTYALETFQDINSNGKMDVTWIGLPKEPFGFSRDARPTLSKPGFHTVSFTLGIGAHLQVIHLQNSISLLP